MGGVDDGDNVSPEEQTHLAALKEFALRLVPPQYGTSGPVAGPPRIWPGQLPDILPFALPVPAGGRIIGSYGRGNHITVLMDLRLRPREVIAFYTGELHTPGWGMPEDGFERGGFTPHQFNQQSQALFCRDTEGVALTVFAEMGPDEITHVRLLVNLDPLDNPCRPSVDREQRAMPVGPPIPPLETPTSSGLVSRGTSSGSDLSTALATLTSDLDLPAIAAHYGDQLREAGWRATEAGVSGPIAWSMWTFIGHDRGQGHGFLTVIREPAGEGRYLLALYARSNGA